MLRDSVGDLIFWPLQTKLVCWWAVSCQWGGLSTALCPAPHQQALAVEPSEQRETQGRAEMSSVLSQGNGPPGTGAHEIDYFGQGGYKMSLTYGNILLLQQHSSGVEGQHHTLTGHKIFLATGRPDLMLPLSLGASLLLSFPHSSSDHRAQPKASPGWFLFSRV